MIRTNTTLEFDDAVIPDAITKAGDRVLPIGAERVAERAKQSIVPSRRMLMSELSPRLQKLYKRTRKPLPGVPSQPGNPPHSPTGILPGLIATAQSGHTMIVGAERRQGQGYPAANTLEFGRTYTLFGKSVTVAPRPFIGPALLAVLPTLAGDFKDSVKG